MFFSTGISSSFCFKKQPEPFPVPDLCLADRYDFCSFVIKNKKFLDQPSKMRVCWTG